MKQLTQKTLPYSFEALEPVISKEIMQLHFDKHHMAYVNAYNTAILKEEKNRETMRDISFNYNGAKLHEIFWENMRSPQENNKAPAGMFSDFDKFKKEFESAAISVEGSGWAILWKDEDKKLSVGQIEKHNLMGLIGQRPVLVLDVWEHAYYLDYQNERKKYVEKWWNVVNWDDVAKRI